MWSSDEAKATSVLILTGDNRSQPDSLRVTTSPFPVNSYSPLAGVKSCNYLENMLALNEARKRGFDEAIRVNEKGEVTTACMANLFWLTAGQLFTPGLETGCLAGTTREFVLETLDCREVRTTMSDLLNAEAMFISSAGVGIKKIACLDERLFQPIDHDILHLLPPADTKTRMSAK
jgi:branched-subunit amino acid aminotransferase/4-amino-4-deoxychorismate lyase